MSKSVFDQKWHRSTLWALENEVEKAKAHFLRDNGWIERTAASGLRLWTKKVEGFLFACDRSTAVALQHSELFDRCPMTQISLDPCGAAHAEK